MKKAKKAKRPITKGSVVAMSVFAAPFLLWGIYSAFYFLRALAEHSEMQSWVETPAMIDQVENVSRHQTRGIGKTKGSGRTMYKVTASYTYEFDGRKYRGERVSLHRGSDGNVEHHHTVYYDLKRYFDEGRPFRCFVNPDKPEQSVLYRDLRWQVSGIHLAHAVLFGGLGAFLIGSAVYYWRRQQRRSGA